MTPTDINAINRTLAEKVMGWAVTADGHKASDPNSIFDDGDSLWLGSGCRFWSPTTDRHDLAEVVAKLTDDQKYRLHYSLFWRTDTPTTPEGFSFWPLTCDPAIIAKAVADVVTGTPTQ